MSWLYRSLAIIVPFALLASLGCGDDADRSSKRIEPVKNPENQPVVEGKKVPVGQNVYLEVMPNGQRRVLISSWICLRNGPLEELLTRKREKEHESILAADIDARKVHEALILAGAHPGAPVRFEPRFRPPTGTTIKISLIYEENNKKVMVPARSWIRNTKTGKELDVDWVFAGSILADNPLDPQGPKTYLANEGDVICVINREPALLDLPIRSDKSDPSAGGRDYEVWTERLPKPPAKKSDEAAAGNKPTQETGDQPEEKTIVVVVLEPVLPRKK